MSDAVDVSAETTNGKLLRHTTWSGIFTEGFGLMIIEKSTRLKHPVILFSTRAVMVSPLKAL